MTNLSINIVNVRGMKAAELTLTELEDDQTPPHGQRGILEAHARIPPREKWLTALQPYNAESAVALERRSFRENATNFLIFVAC